MKRIKTIILALALISTFAAQAGIIEISGYGDTSIDGQWQIDLVDGNFDTLQDTLMEQIWWGNRDLAGLFATTLQIGHGNVGSGLVGPDFSYAVNGLFSNHAACQTFDVSTQDCGAGGQLTFFGDETSRVFTYATATRVPEPATLILLSLSLLGLRLTRLKTG